MSESPKFSARPYVVEEANYAQLLKLKPNVAIQPWGATEAHNFHLPHGTDNIEARAVAEASVARANAAGARCAILPCIPYGIDHSQTTQVITITMRAATQLALLYDIAESLVRQGIDRLVILNYHGGNEFKSLIRDVMFDVPIFILQVHTYLTAPGMKQVLTVKDGDHADEHETSLLLHLTPEWVAPLHTAGPGKTAKSKLPKLSANPAAWTPRYWPIYAPDTGSGNPSASTAAKGAHLLSAMVNAISPILLELSQAKPGQYPFVIQKSPLSQSPRRR